MDTAPHFVGIGAPRCGTTWIFKMLRMHPGVWMPWKEIHYFDSIDPDTNSGYDIRDRGFRLRAGWPAALRRLAVSSVPGAAAATRRWFPLRAMHAPGIGWTYRYFTGDASLAWYRGLFREGESAGLTCGEITPAYCMLSPRAIAGFATALPAGTRLPDAAKSARLGLVGPLQARARRRPVARRRSRTRN